ncbi:MAG TPA: phosphate regulon transcriptional regulator PhoB [Burkholderiaceae bacterium]|nr:phosphate regulon transcriptional regulator PhoB [Burkholderiaceae bacterium]HQR75370.1 phosphate regulon transcriptional regulator PhoB [Burkholderiaceae bacterium]
MSTNILIVEDEPAIQELVAYTCSSNGYAVRRAESVRAAREAIGQQLPDLVLLDWMLPDRPGIDLLKDLRTEDRTRTVPVIMLTARGSEADRVVGLDTGADDYVVKPFSPRELVSRIRAVFRRRAPQHSGEAVSYGPLTIDPARHEVLVDGSPVTMGLAEFKLLSFLVNHPDRVFSRAQLLDSVWGDHVFIEERTVDVHVLRLRKALTPARVQGLVQTVRGLGYKLSTRPEH